jgi:hypothetical protein
MVSDLEVVVTPGNRYAQAWPRPILDVSVGWFADLAVDSFTDRPLVLGCIFARPERWLRLTANFSALVVDGPQLV